MRYLSSYYLCGTEVFDRVLQRGKIDGRFKLLRRAFKVLEVMCKSWMADKHSDSEVSFN